MSSRVTVATPTRLATLTSSTITGTARRPLGAHDAQSPDRSLLMIGPTSRGNPGNGDGDHDHRIGSTARPAHHGEEDHRVLERGQVVPDERENQVVAGLAVPAVL